MYKIYDKLLLSITVLILAGGVFLYIQTSGDATSLNSPIDNQTADNPYIPEKALSCPKVISLKSESLPTQLKTISLSATASLTEVE